MGEIFGDDAAYQRFQDAPCNFTPTEILTKILSGNLRPRLPPGNDAPIAVHHLLEHCWAFDPNDRPSFKKIKDVLAQVRSMRKPASDHLVIDSQLLADQLKRLSKRMEERYEKVAKEFQLYSHVVVPPPVWRQIYLQHVRPPLVRHEDVVLLRCSLTNLSGLLSAHDPQVAIDTVNTMHRVFDEMIEKNGRVYRLFWHGTTVTAVGGAPFGLDLDPVHSIAQIALDYMVWGHNSRAPSQPPLQLRFGLHSGPASAGCLDYSAAHYVLFGDITKTAYLIETASRPSRILVSDEFNERLKKLAKVYVKYRVIESSQPVHGYDKKTFWLVGSNYFDQQYLLDDILYGKDELDQAKDGHVHYGTEEGILKDHQRSSTEPVSEKQIRGTGVPEMMHSAKIVCSLRKRHAHCMRIPPQHVLDAQVKPHHHHHHHHIGKGHHEQHTQGELAEIEGAKQRQDSVINEAAELPPTHADLIVGIFHRTNLDEDMQEEVDPQGHLLQNITLETVHFNHKHHHHQHHHGKGHPVKSDQSVLSSIQSHQISVASGEAPSPKAARLNVAHTPVLGAVLGLNGIMPNHLETVPRRPYDGTATKHPHQPKIHPPTVTDPSESVTRLPTTEEINENPSLLLLNPTLMPVESDVLTTGERQTSSAAENTLPDEHRISNFVFPVYSEQLLTRRSGLEDTEEPAKILSDESVFLKVEDKNDASSSESRTRNKMEGPAVSSQSAAAEFSIPSTDNIQTDLSDSQSIPQNSEASTQEKSSVTLSSVNTSDVHVFADPPQMAGSFNSLDLSPSLRRHIKNLTRNYESDLHSVEGDSEEFHNDMRDRHVQDIRDHEAQHTDSDSFHLRLPRPVQVKALPSQHLMPGPSQESPALVSPRAHMQVVASEVSRREEKPIHTMAESDSRRLTGHPRNVVSGQDPVEKKD